jgi:iron complex transport system permease protein
MRKNMLVFSFLALALSVLFVLNLLMGSVSIPFSDVWNILTGGVVQHAQWKFIVLETRLPQACTAILCGSALAVCGLLLQTAFRNPLAGPGVFGITKGACLGVAVVMLLFGGSVSLQFLQGGDFAAVMVAAFIGAMLVTGLLFFFSTLLRSNVMLLIVGIMVGYLSSSVITLLNYLATEQGVRSYMLWGMASFGGVSLRQLPLFVSLTVVGLCLAFTLIKPLNALLLGDRYAANLGLNVRRARMLVIISSGVLVAIVTAYCGPIMFIGLAVPHLARTLFRSSDHRILMPATALCGSVLALLCNFIARMPGFEGALPVNSVTALVGAPVIAAVLFGKRRNDYE